VSPAQLDLDDVGARDEVSVGPCASVGTDPGCEPQPESHPDPPKPKGKADRSEDFRHFVAQTGFFINLEDIYL
jgi:hypothetical protein